jgi:hypothetical protein
MSGWELAAILVTVFMITVVGCGTMLAIVKEHTRQAELRSEEHVRKTVELMRDAHPEGRL